jgi:glycosyltransferase involved in cell wall biosynthesis
MFSCTVIVPNYNHENFLQERIQSIIDQQNACIECILLDDASTDSSVQLIKEFLPILKDGQLILNKVNSGSTYVQWNFGVDNARNNLIHIAESDDIAEKELLFSLSKMFDQDQEVVLSFCKSNLIDANSTQIGTWQYDDPIFDQDFIMDGVIFIEKYLIHKNVIPNASSVLFRKDIYLKVGSADIHLKTNSDWLIWLKMLCYGKVAYTSSLLNNFRKHENSVTARNNSLKTLQFREIYSKTLRKKFRKYLKKNSFQWNTKKLYKINENYISYDYGYESLYLLEHKQYFHSIVALILSFFTGTIKTYFIKKYSFDFYNYMFKK